MKQFNYILLLSTLVLSILSSCIDQDLDDCVPENEGVRIYFSERTIKNAAGVRIDNKEVNDIKLFIFDEKGNYIKTEHDTNITFSSDYYMTSFLEPGIYTFVSWINLYTPYNQNDFSTLDEMRVYIEKNKEDEVLINPHALFQAYETSTTITTNKDQTVRLYLTQNTNTINIRTVNFRPDNDNDHYRMTITARNGIYKFDNSFASDTEEVHYISSLQIDDKNQLLGTQNILRLSEDRKDPILKVDNPTTGATIYQARLMDLIDSINAGGTMIDIANTHIYDIVLTFKSHDTIPPEGSLTVSINGWIINEKNTEL